MDRGDLDYKIMDYLNVPVGNIVPIIHSVADCLTKVNTIEPDFEDIKKEFQTFSKIYFKLLRAYSKLGVLDENITEKHGRSVVEEFKKNLGNIAEPFDELEKLVTNENNTARIQELGVTLYGITTKLLEGSKDFSTPMWRAYKELRRPT